MSKYKYQENETTPATLVNIDREVLQKLMTKNDELRNYIYRKALIDL